MCPMIVMFSKAGKAAFSIFFPKWSWTILNGPSRKHRNSHNILPFELIYWCLWNTDGWYLLYLEAQAAQNRKRVWSWTSRKTICEARRQDLHHSRHCANFSSADRGDGLRRKFSRCLMRKGRGWKGVGLVLCVPRTCLLFTPAFINSFNKYFSKVPTVGSVQCLALGVTKWTKQSAPISCPAFPAFLKISRSCQKIHRLGERGKQDWSHQLSTTLTCSGILSIVFVLITKDSIQGVALKHYY